MQTCRFAGAEACAGSRRWTASGSRWALLEENASASPSRQNRRSGECEVAGSAGRQRWWREEASRGVSQWIRLRTLKTPYRPYRSMKRAPSPSRPGDRRGRLRYANLSVGRAFARAEEERGAPGPCRQSGPVPPSYVSLDNHSTAHLVLEGACLSVCLSLYPRHVLSSCLSSLSLTLPRTPFCCSPPPFLSPPAASLACCSARAFTHFPSARDLLQLLPPVAHFARRDRPCAILARTSFLSALLPRAQELVGAAWLDLAHARRPPGLPARLVHITLDSPESALFFFSFSPAPAPGSCLPSLHPPFLPVHAVYTSTSV